QSIFLFEGSIRENMLLANPHATDDEVWHALRITQAHQFVNRLPGGLDYKVGERGRRLSVGERQLLAFARALLANPKILILDEATASVDLYTETLIQEAIETVLENRTSIVIAHRLTTVVNSDRIIVMENGKITEIGKHKELLNQGGLYSEIYETYFKHQSFEYLSQISS
ncbi:MAG: ATP-binding cassette domain-containing protein, partial [Candidatus Hodarchaeales archaeon]